MQRARKDEDKARRRQAILETADRLWRDHSYASLTMDRVAEAAKVAKGTLYLYFQTREQMFLALLEDAITEWFAYFDGRLRGGRSAWTADRAAEVLARSFEERPSLRRLLALLEPVFEQNIDRATTLAFKRMLLERMSVTGVLLERRLPELAPGDGLRMLLHLRALLVGIHQMADNSAVVREAIAEDPNLEVFRVDFGREFRIAAAALIRGWKQKTGRNS